MSQGNDSEWNILWDLFLNEQEPQEKDKLMDALTASKEISILNRYTYKTEFYSYGIKKYILLFSRLLQYTKNESHVRSQDYFFIVSQISRNPIGTQLIWDFLRYTVYNIL